MKNKFIIYTCFLALINSFSSCSLKDITIDKTTGENKSFLMINNNVIKTTIQLRLFDEGSNTLISKPMVVGISSNKKLVDLKGVYTSVFTTNNGIVNFGIDPNLDISVMDTLKLNIVSTNENREYIPIIKKINLTRVTNKIVVLYHSASKIKAIASTKNEANYSIKVNVASGVSPTYPVLNGQKNGIPDFNLFNVNDVLGISIYNNDDEWINWYYPSNVTAKSDIVAEVKFTDPLDLNTRRGSIGVIYATIEGEQVFTDGFFQIVKRNNTTEGYNATRKGVLVIPKGANLMYIFDYSYKINSDLNTCPAGFNFAFDGIDATSKPEFAYKTSRITPDGKTLIQTIGLAQPTKAFPVFNTDELFYSNNKNKVEFADNLQYDISPKSLDLGGKDACGKTFNFKVTPIVGLNKYNILLRLGCEGKYVNATPSLMLLYKKMGNANYGGLTLANGVATVYLADKTNYDISGTYNSNNISFNFTTNLANTETMRQTTLNSNPDLREAYYTTDANDPFKLNILLYYKSNACPF